MSFWLYYERQLQLQNPLFGTAKKLFYAENCCWIAEFQGCVVKCAPLPNTKKIVFPHTVDKSLIKASFSFQEKIIYVNVQATC